MAKRLAVPEDELVASRLRSLRISLGLSQTEMANAVGVSWQQFQKYESGLNRISSGRLFNLAKALDTPVSYFFEGLPVELTLDEIGESGGISPQETLKLVRGYRKIRNDKTRKSILDLIESISD